ncbi:MAG: efflux RND transporter periplasmic adaptor subunit [Sedimentisphaeraceae bacterium JB056]
MKTRPVAKKKTAQPTPTRVNIITAKENDNKIKIEAMGTVKPALNVEIKSQVSGEIIYVSPNFVPGGRFEKGEVIIKIDPRDYELAVKQKKQELTQAKANLRLEYGQQSIAKKEYELLGESISKEDEEFVLRKPQLLKAEAEVERLEAQLDEAKLNLERTVIKASFNSTVQQRYVNLGSSVNSGGELVSLYGTDEYWVEISLPVDELRWIRIPESIESKGATAKVFIPGSTNDSYKQGHVFRLRSELETQGRMARILISVSKPLLSKRDDTTEPPLLAGSFVRVEIEGTTLKDSIKIPRRALRDNNKIWINNNNKLKVREISPIYKDSNYIYTIEGIENGEKVITSDIASPIEDMILKIEENEQQ